LSDAQRLKIPTRVPLPAGFTLHHGAYSIVRVVGEGGFSLTYLAYEGTRRLPVAVKEFFPMGCVRDGLQIVPASTWDATSFSAARANFLNEGAILERFNHPGIVRVYATYEENGTAYMMMEYLPGESLAQGLARRGPMNRAQAMEVARQVGAALQAVHSSGVVHSDVKPENVIKTPDGRLVLLDFGVSRGYLSSKAAKGAMQAVSPGYSPPEQYHYGKALTPASDVYAMGATLWHLLTGRLTPDARSRTHGMALAPLIDLNPTVDDELWMAIERALQVDPQRRQENVRQFLEQLGLDKDSAANPGLFADGPVPAFDVSLVGEMFGHEAAVTCLALHPNGQLLVSGDKLGLIRLWTWPDGQPLGVVPGHGQAVSSLAISSDGLLLASGCLGGRITLWDMTLGKDLQVLAQTGPAVQGLAFSPVENCLACALTDATIRIYRPGQNVPVVLKEHEGPVNGVCYSPNGQWLASCGNDAALKFHDASTLRTLRALRGHERIVQSVGFSRDCNLLLSSSNDLSARVWDLGAGFELRRLKGHKGMVWQAQFASDPELIVTASSDRRLRWFRLDTGREIKSVEAHSSHCKAILCDPARPLVASCGGDNVVRIWQFGYR
jgi:WD40 repeat protein